MLELYQTFLGYIFIMILGYKTCKDLFKPKISYDAPARECVGPRDIRSWLQNFKGFSWGGYGFADRFMILTYLCPTI